MYKRIGKLIGLILSTSLILVGCSNSKDLEKKIETMKTQQEKLLKENKELKEQVKEFELKEKAEIDKEETILTEEENKDGVDRKPSNNKTTSASSNKDSSSNKRTSAPRSTSANSNNNTEDSKTQTEERIPVEKPTEPSKEEYWGYYCKVCGVKSFFNSYCDDHMPEPETPPDKNTTLPSQDPGFHQ